MVFHPVRFQNFLPVAALVALSGCVEETPTQVEEDTRTTALLQRVQGAGVAGPVAVATLDGPEGSFDRIFSPSNVRDLPARPAASAGQDSQPGSDAPDSDLFFVVNPGPEAGLEAFMRGREHTFNARFRFFCCDPNTGICEQKTDARVDSLVQHPIDLTGGHKSDIHDFASKPHGMWDPESGEANADGNFLSVYTAERAAGDEDMIFSWQITDPTVPESCRQPVTNELKVGVRVDGLVELDSLREKLHFEDISSDHFSVFYVTPVVKDSTYRLADDYYLESAQTDSLRVNAASLIFGGLNDAPTPDWTWPHQSHRLGTDLDLDGKSDSTHYHDRIIRIGHQLGFKLCEPHGDPPDHVHCFWRLY